MIEKTREIAVKIVDDWHMQWFSQEDYRSRALGVDANMQESLMRRIKESLDHAIASERELIIETVNNFCGVHDTEMAESIATAIRKGK